MGWASNRVRRKALKHSEVPREVLAYHGWVEHEIRDTIGGMGGAVSFQFRDTRSDVPRYASAIWSDTGFGGAFFFGEEGPPESPQYINDLVRFEMAAVRDPNERDDVEDDDEDDED